MDLKFCKNIGENNYDMILHGEIGRDINGGEVAREIAYLNAIGAKSITERINTIGGTVYDAYSVVSANFFSKAEIITINEGVADSSGGWILASGNKGSRFAMDYSSMLIHNVSHKGVMLEDMEDGKLKDELTIMRNSIAMILANNSGKTEKEVISIMNESTRMTAKMAKEVGFIDEIKSSAKKPELADNLTSLQVMNICKDFNKPKINNNNKNMETVKSYLNLSAEASESSVLSSVQEISNKAKVSEDLVKNQASEIAELKNKSTEKDAAISDLKGQIAVFESAQNKSAVDAAISSGKFSEENREALVGQVTSMGVENFNAMIGMMKLPHVDVLGAIANKSTGSGSTTEKELAEKFQNLAENDTAELKRIKNESPAEFAKMEAAWNKN